MLRYTIRLDAEGRESLEMLLRIHTTEKRMAERARIILLAADGKRVAEIAEKLDCSKRRVCGWKKRYIEEGIAGLEEKQRSGRPASIAPEVIENLNQ